MDPGMRWHIPWPNLIFHPTSTAYVISRWFTCKPGQTLFLMPAFFGPINLIFYTTSCWSIIQASFGPINLIFHTIFSSACYVPSTQLHSHASILRPTKLIFHTNFLSACHVPSTQVHSHAGVLRPTNFIFHTNFLSACHVPSTQIHSHASISVHWILIIPSIVPSLFDLISSIGPNLSHYVHLVLLMPHSLNSIHTSLMNCPHLVPFRQSCFIQPSELCIAYVILSDRSYFMQLIR